jgi:hypothetical protein
MKYIVRWYGVDTGNANFDRMVDAKLFIRALAHKHFGTNGSYILDKVSTSPTNATYNYTSKNEDIKLKITVFEIGNFER